MWVTFLHVPGLKAKAQHPLKQTDIISPSIKAVVEDCLEETHISVKICMFELHG